MIDKELKIEETESSHTLGGTIKYTKIHQSRWKSHSPPHGGGRDSEEGDLCHPDDERHRPGS